MWFTLAGTSGITLGDLTANGAAVPTTGEVSAVTDANGVATLVVTSAKTANTNAYTVDAATNGPDRRADHGDLPDSRPRIVQGHQHRRGPRPRRGRHGPAQGPAARPVRGVLPADRPRPASGLVVPGQQRRRAEGRQHGDLDGHDADVAGGGRQLLLRLHPGGPRPRRAPRRTSRTPTTTTPTVPSGPARPAGRCHQLGEPDGRGDGRHLGADELHGRAAPAGHGGRGPVGSGPDDHRHGDRRHDGGLAYKTITLTGSPGVYFASDNLGTGLVNSIQVTSNGSGVFTGYAVFTKPGAATITATSEGKTVTVNEVIAARRPVSSTTSPSTTSPPCRTRL